MNHLEQLVTEWYEYQGYFVRQNVRVAKRERGGYDGELDVVAYNPSTDHLAHIEPSLDSHSWEKREKRFSKKFKIGRQFIPGLFGGVDLPEKIEQIALLAHASKVNHQTIGGGQVVLVSELIGEIMNDLTAKEFSKEAVPENLPLIRTLQLAATHDSEVLSALKTK